MWFQTVLQRWGNSTAQETLRRNFNAWLYELPHSQARGVIDAERVFRTSNAAVYTIDPTLTCDSIHPSFQGLEPLAACAGAFVS
ncbi:hypothetical protein ACFYV7_15030 [Nocardia suismassiliense]|uniref:Uncharacterized protein n=1 Tax=Nocardia suismassiliense TaxID=2077092 RepID=A0ABW6QT48_9NOCA